MWHHVPKVVFLVPKGLLLFLWDRLGCGLGWVLGPHFHSGMGWVGLGWVEQNWTHGQLWNHMLFRLHYTTGAQSVFPGCTTPSARLYGQFVRWLHRCMPANVVNKKLRHKDKAKDSEIWPFGNIPPEITLYRKSPIGTPPESSNILKAKIWKLTLARTPDAIRPTRRGPDPNRPIGVISSGGISLAVISGGLSSRRCLWLATKDRLKGEGQGPCRLQGQRQWLSELYV